MRAEDVLPDEVNAVAASEVSVRKGTVGAFLASARQLAAMDLDAPERAVVVADVCALLPALRAIGLFEVLEVRDPALRALVEAGA